MASSANIVLPVSETLAPHVENGIPFYRFNRLGEFVELEHLIFTRLGGESSPPFASLNVSYDTGDEPGKVRENLRRIRAATSCASLIYARQNHSSNIGVLRSYPRYDPAVPYPLHGKDGFITQLPDLLMMIKVADCQAIFLYDPIHKVASMIHAGWRGSVQNILGNAVHLMRANFCSAPSDIVAGIGPSLGPCCAEFRHWQQELPPSFIPFQVQKNYFDFWAISQNQLLEAGLLGGNIEVAGLCTKCHPEIFYSYRGEGRTGRFAMAIGIKSRGE
jgi:YfiH family protein